MFTNIMRDNKWYIVEPNMVSNDSRKKPFKPVMRWFRSSLEDSGPLLILLVCQQLIQLYHFFQSRTTINDKLTIVRVQEILN